MRTTEIKKTEQYVWQDLRQKQFFEELVAYFECTSLESYSEFLAQCDKTIFIKAVGSSFFKYSGNLEKIKKEIQCTLKFTFLDDKIFNDVLLIYNSIIRKYNATKKWLEEIRSVNPEKFDPISEPKIADITYDDWVQYFESDLIEKIAECILNLPILSNVEDQITDIQNRLTLGTRDALKNELSFSDEDCILHTEKIISAPEIILAIKKKCAEYFEKNEILQPEEKVQAINNVVKKYFPIVNEKCVVSTLFNRTESNMPSSRHEFSKSNNDEKNLLFKLSQLKEKLVKAQTTYALRKKNEFDISMFGFSAIKKYISTTAMITEVNRLQTMLENGNISVLIPIWVSDKAAQQGTLKKLHDELVQLKTECENLVCLKKNIDCGEYLEKTNNILLITY